MKERPILFSAPMVRAILDGRKSQREIAKKFGVSQSTAWAVLNGKTFKTQQAADPVNMPRWASRITLEVVSVRVERLNDITEEDANAEGVEQDHTLDMSPYGYRGYGGDSWCETARASFASLWRSINGADSLAANPWVWVVEFKRVLP